MLKALQNAFPHDPSPWTDYADEHILFIRALDQVSPSVFETIRIKRNPCGDPTSVKYRHDVIFIDEYLTAAAAPLLNNILRGFGYKDLDDFVMQNATSDEFIYDDQGDLDRENSPSYVIDLWLLASLIAESRGGTDDDTAEIATGEEEALKLFADITGLDHVKHVGGCVSDFFTPIVKMHEHISEVVKGDQILFNGEIYTAKANARTMRPDEGREWNVEVEGGCETHLYASYFPDGKVPLVQKIVLRNAKCSDCTHHFCENAGDPALELYGCEAKGWEDTDPEYPAWKADCGHFCYEGFTSPGTCTDPCFEVTQAVDDNPWAYRFEPAGYVVAEGCRSFNETTAREILKQVKDQRLLDETVLDGQEIDYEHLGLRWWNYVEGRFVDLVLPTLPEDKG